MSITIEPRRVSWRIEKRGLQATVALASLVPITAGGWGMIQGLAAFTHDSGITALSPDSHVRYLSGLLFAIGLGFSSTIVHIEAHGARFRLLTALVMIGGFGRLLGLFLAGTPAPAMLAALGMELAVTPLLALWQQRIARRRPPRWEHIRRAAR